VTDLSSTADGEPLGRMMRDLVALSVLPTVWQRSEPLEVAQSLAVVLEKTLGLALVGVLLETRADGEVRQVVRSAGRFLQATEAEAVVRALEPTFGLAERAPETIEDPFGRGATRLVCQPIAWQAGRWLLFAASEAASFPSPSERLLLGAGASHAAVALDRCMAFKLLRDNEERFRESEDRWRSLTRQTQESAESASRDKDELLANVSHEIRTPMNAILGMTELALDSQLTDEQRGWLQTVKLAGEHLLVIVDGLLDFSKGEARKATLEPKEFALRSELASMTRAAAVRAQRKDLELICDIDDRVPDRLVGDVGKLRQVLLNLVDNAIKFTTHGEVQVLVTSSEAEPASREAKLTFSVRDTGIGIPSHLHALVFEPFAQADNSTTRRFGGTGLGLTIAASLTALMGGSIELCSEPDVGSTFAFCLGFERAQGNAIADTRAEPWPGVRALVVQDNLAARGLLVRWLSDWQMEASAVTDGLSAMQVLMTSARTSRPVRLLLVDGNAPGMPGAVPRASVGAGAAHKLRLVLVEPGIEAAAPGAPREVVIQKPVVKAELYAALRRLLSPNEGVPSHALPARVMARTNQSRRVLVAEDNEFNVVLTRELLLRRGHDVHVVRSGMGALAELERARYDVLLLDLHMPEMDGFEVIRALRAGEQLRGGHLPVIALTARARPADRERCLAAGMDGFLAKPINSAALWGAVEGVSVG
jgi:two-component system sensor histidine kinase/response regulator